MNNDTVLTELRRIAFTTLGLGADDLDHNVSLLEMGLDSLMLLRFGQEIERTFGVKLEIAWFFTNLPTLATLSEHVAGLAGDRLAGTSQPENGTTAEESSPQSVTTEEPAGEDTTAADATDNGLASLFRQQAEALESLFNQQLDALTARAGDTRKSSSTAGDGRHAAASAGPSGIRHDFRGIRLAAEEGLTAEQEAFIDAAVDRHVTRTAKSRELTQKHRHVLADWKNTLSFRTRLKDAVYPIVGDGSDGARFTDVDGNEYIDIALGMGVNFMGHRHSSVVGAVEKRCADGFELGPQCSMTGRAAELVGRLTGMERVCFCNTGSEAVMAALRLARAKTGRHTVVLFNGSYHGIFDGVLGAEAGEGVEPLSPGTPPGMVGDIMLLDYDSPESLAAIERVADDIAAVLVEPVQSRRPQLQPQTFLRRLRRLTREAGIALIFDEMINGFRIAPGGAQEHFGIRADIALYGKAIGGGLPVGVIAGESAYLDLIDGGYWQYGDDSVPSDEAIVFGGTFCRHPFAMEAVAAVATFMLEEGPALQDRVSRLAEMLQDELNRWFRDQEVPLRVVRFGSQFKFESYGPWTQLANPIELDLFYLLLVDAGVYCWERRTCCLSVAHTEGDIRTVVRVVKEAVQRLRGGGFAFSLERGVPDAVYEVTSVQKRLFAAMQRDNGQAPYHMPAAWMVDGELDIGRLEIAVGDIIRRHECLRSGFRIAGDRLVREVADEPLFFIERIDPAGRAPVDIARDFIRPFDFAAPPLLRIGVAEIEDGWTLLLFDSLHIVVDGISLETVTAELNALYNGEFPCTPGGTYTEYAGHMHDFTASDACRAQLEYWRHTLKNAPPPVFSRPRAADVPCARAGHVRTTIDAHLLERIRKTAASCGATPYMLMLAAYTVLMRSLTGTDDIVVGTVTSGRPGDRFDATVGMFVNTLPLRVAVDDGQPFRDFLGTVRSVCAGAYQHQDVPYELIAEQSGDVVGTLFTYETADSRTLALSGLSVEEMEVSIPGAMYECSLDAIEKNAAVHLDFEFDSGALDESCVRMWAGCFTAILDHVCNDPGTPVGGIPLMPAETAASLHERWNDTRREYPSSRTIVDLFLAAVSAHPGATAVIDGEGAATYARLDGLSERIAAVLAAENGTSGGFLAAVCGPPAMRLVVAIIGILRAGGAFLPLEHDGPAARAASILEDAEVDVLIGEGELFDALDAERKQSLDRLLAGAPDEDGVVGTGPAPDSLAYVIYTSGSTGTPKGCEVGHAALHNYISWAMDYYFPGGRAAHFCLTSPLAFDMSLMSLFVPLCSGGTLRLPGADSNPAEALALGVSPRTETDALNLTPSHVRMIGGLGVTATNVRLAVVGGEALVKGDVDILLGLNPDMEIYNEYGPTEATVGCTAARVTPGAPPTIGEPIANTTAYIMDALMRPLPPGGWGELCIGGTCLAYGYRNRPDLTRERFVVSSAAGERVYRTGDRARRSMDGTIELAGRLDDQVKIAGHRIEPGEIEAVLRLCTGVDDAVVVAGDGLAAFVTGDCNVDAVHGELGGLLPEYMQPRRILKLDALPVSSGGKVDRAALCALAEENAEETAPSDETCDVSPVLALMRDLAGNPRMKETDNFFAAGGNSLDAVAVVARCGGELGLQVGLREFFANPTAEAVRRFAGETTEQGGLTHAPSVDRIPQTSGQRQIWLAARDAGSAYNMTEMFLFEGPLDAGLLERSFAELVRRHEILRTTFHEERGGLYQSVRDFEPGRLFFDRTDLSGRPEPEEAARGMADEELRYGFDLENGPLMRVRLLHVGEDRHLCLLNIHHIITDGWSAGLMLDEVSHIYRGGGEMAGEPDWQYRDYAVWHDGYLAGGADVDRDYWRRTLAPPIPAVSLPGRRVRTGGGARTAAAEEMHIPSPLARSLDKLGRESGATLFMTLLAGLTAVLHQRTSDGDIIIGTPAAGRVMPEFESMPGYFLNTLPVRMKVDGPMTFRELLGEAVRTASAAFSHQCYPFDLIADAFGGERREGRNPLFDVMLILQNTADYRFDLPDISARRFYSPRSKEAKFEIMLELESGADDLGGVIEYDTTVYSRGHITALAADLLKTLEHITAHPDESVSSLFSLLSREDEAERRRFMESISDVNEEF